MKGSLAQVKAFDIEGIDINYIDGRSGYTPLIQTIRDRNYQMIQYLLTLPNININSVDNKKFGFPPLSHAVQMHELGIMRTLIDNGANVNEPSTNDKNPFNTPLMIAAWGGRLESVRLLVENGACVNQQDKGNGFTPLIKAVFKGNIDIVKYLLEQGADKGVFSFEKKTALDYAYEKNHKEIIELLKG
jgi:ankyrin repeat protein